ncbi:MAG: class I SAM-dependent methyltransferase [Desulfobacteraceae bacterium]|nr:class I SAM-dependent methyltransferase [Desulfobacteraceae bacterium]MBC2720692.1 class I SAM-dependent methyltransferase [Desulfobacteraceae bacterium]
MDYFTARQVSPDCYQSSKLPQWMIGEIGDIESVVLDVGCSFGQTIRGLITNGFNNVKGIDISNEAVDYCQKEGFNVECVDFADYQGEAVDVIIMSHILEHFPKDNISLMLKKAYNILNPNGKLIISTPNAQSNTGSYWAYEDFTHSTIFTSGSLYYVLKIAGFRTVKFIDITCTAHMTGVQKVVKKGLWELYRANKNFWNWVTGSSYHAPSPQIFSYEIKVVSQR